MCAQGCRIAVRSRIRDYRSRTVMRLLVHLRYLAFYGMCECLRRSVLSWTPEAVQVAASNDEWPRGPPLCPAFQDIFVCWMPQVCGTLTMPS